MEADVECLQVIILFLWLDFYWVEIFEIFPINQPTLVKEEIDFEKCPKFANVLQLLTSQDDPHCYSVARHNLYLCQGTQTPCKLNLTPNPAKVERPFLEIDHQQKIENSEGRAERVGESDLSAGDGHCSDWGMSADLNRRS